MRCGISLLVGWLIVCFMQKNRQNSQFIINIQTRQLLWVLFLLEAARFLWLLQLSPLSIKLFKLFPPVILTSGSCQ